MRWVKERRSGSKRRCSREHGRWSLAATAFEQCNTSESFFSHRGSRWIIENAPATLKPTTCVRVPMHEAVVTACFGPRERASEYERAQIATSQSEQFLIEIRSCTEGRSANVMQTVCRSEVTIAGMSSVSKVPAG